MQKAPAQGRRRRDYFTFAALASSATASFELMLVFMNLATTSKIAPWVADGKAMPCANDGTSAPVLLVASMSSVDLMAQASNLSRDTPERTGMEPLFKLKIDWNFGFMMALARAICPFFAFASFCVNMANESMLKV